MKKARQIKGADNIRAILKFTTTFMVQIILGVPLVFSAGAGMEYAVLVVFSGIAFVSHLFLGAYFWNEVFFLFFPSFDDYEEANEWSKSYLAKQLYNVCCWRGTEAYYRKKALLAYGAPLDIRRCAFTPTHYFLEEIKEGKKPAELFFSKREKALFEEYAANPYPDISEWVDRDKNEELNALLEYGPLVCFSKKSFLTDFIFCSLMGLSLMLVIKKRQVSLINYGLELI